MKLVVDISEHNGYIDFSKLKKAGINDVIIRIGWIGNKNNHTVDKYFEDYYKRAKNEKMNIGFYVYSYCMNLETLVSGINWAIDKLKGKVCNLAVFLDLEDEQICNLSRTNLTNQIKTFCNELECQGIKAGVYANKYWFENKINTNEIVGYKIWLAEWSKNEKPSFKYKCDLWQFTDNGRIDGINGRVDISKCMCDCEEYIENDEEVFEIMKKYQNGSTEEPVYSDSNLQHYIGKLNKYEQVDCLGKIDNKYIVLYKVDGTNYHKIGFVKYNGGIDE